MLKVNLAHLRIQGQSVAVFEADDRNNSKSGRDDVLRVLTARAVAANLRVDKAALAFVEHGKLRFYGAPDLVRFLANNPSVVSWTHYVEV